MPLAATPFQVVVNDMASSDNSLCMSTLNYATGKFKVTGVRNDLDKTQLWGHWGVNAHGIVTLPVSCQSINKIVSAHSGVNFIDTKVQETNPLIKFTLDVGGNTGDYEDAHWRNDRHGWVAFPVAFAQFRRLATNHQGVVWMQSQARESNTLAGFTLDVGDNSTPACDAQWIAVGR